MIKGVFPKGAAEQDNFVARDPETESHRSPMQAASASTMILKLSLKQCVKPEQNLYCPALMSTVFLQ